MAIYDSLNMSEGMKTYLRLTSLGLGYGLYKAIDIAQQAGQNQVWGMDADTAKQVLLGVAVSAFASTFALGTKAREKMVAGSIEQRVGDDDDSIDRAA